MRQIKNISPTRAFRLLLLVLSMAIFAPVSFSQVTDRPVKKHKQKREELRAQKVAFISNRLSLTPEEAENFWPVYNEYERESMETHKKKRQLLKELRTVDEMSDKEAYNKMKDLLNLETKHAELRLTYLAKFAEVLDKKRAAKVYIIEEKWKKTLLKKLDKKGAHGGHRPPPRD